MKSMPAELRDQIIKKDAEVTETLRAFYQPDPLNCLSELANLVNVSIVAYNTGSPLAQMLAQNLNHMVPAVARALKLDVEKAVIDISTLARTRRADL